MTVVRSGLRESLTFGIAVQVYRRHRLDAGGRCVFCGHDRCRARLAGAKVIRAAGEDPAVYNELAGGEAGPVVRGSASSRPTYAATRGAVLDAGGAVPARSVAPGPGPRWGWSAASSPVPPATPARTPSGGQGTDLPPHIAAMVRVGGAVGYAFAFPDLDPDRGGPRDAGWT